MVNISFHTYYTDPRNLTTNKEYLTLYNFPDSHRVKPAKVSKDILGYITIYGIKIYISKYDKHNVYKDDEGNKNTEKTHDLFFTIPTMIDDKMFDFHYHFGIRTHAYIDILDKQYVNILEIIARIYQRELNSIIIVIFKIIHQLKV
jgi:hypothetical protein